MLPAYGLYTHIRANEIRSRALVAGLFVLDLVLAYGLVLMVRASSGSAPGGRASGLAADLHAAAWDLLWAGPLALAATFLWLLVAYHGHQALVAGVVGARPVTRREAPELHHLLEELCIARGLAMPALAIADDPALNAFASGLNPQQYTITVTTGLAAALAPREMRAVLAHELTHIRNDDVRTMMLAVVITGIFAFVAEAAYRSDLIGGILRARSDGKRAGALPAMLVGLGLVALAWVLSRALRLALSRTREYVADAGAVELTKDPDALIAALRKIAGRGDLTRAPSGVMELCFDNPRAGFLDLLATHPSIEDRIAALTRYAGGRPGPADDRPSVALP